MRTVAALFVLALLATPALAADFTVPPPYEWIVVPCATWNCAVAEMMNAAGDPYVISMPTTNTEHPWIVLKRVQAGSVEVSPDAPWTIEQFTVLTEASSRFASLVSTLSPVMITTNSGGFLIASRNPSRRRSAAH